MTLLEFFTHPVTRELWAGIQHTAPRVMRAWQEHAAPKPVTSDDLQRAAADTAQPTFDDPPTGESHAPAP
jgi:hypothetical protein